MFRVLLTTLLVFSFQFSSIAETLTIATWNFYSNYSANSDSKRQKLLTATKVLKDIDADIVVLQEVSKAGTENLKAFINTTPFVYDVITTEKPSVDKNYAMLYKSDKVTPKSDSVRYFDDVKHLKHDFFERDLGYAVFTTVEEDNTFILFNCHISHQGHKGLEVNKLDDVYERVMFGVENAFFAGDFNIEDGIKSVAFTGEGILSEDDDLPFEAVLTPPNDITRWESENPLDNIFFNTDYVKLTDNYIYNFNERLPDTIDENCIAGDPDSERDPALKPKDGDTYDKKVSDHYPVVATFEILGSNTFRSPGAVKTTRSVLWAEIK